LLQTDFIKRQIDRSAKDAVNQSSINQTDVRGFQFIVPPLAEQHAFAARVAAISRLKSACGSHLEQLDGLFASLQYLAFRELTVKDAERELAVA
jgi:type I restriction enzyme S subunit